MMCAPTASCDQLGCLAVKVHLVTFGSPRAGNAEFCGAMLKDVHIARFVGTGDPVPTLPPERLGFSHPVWPLVRLVYSHLNRVAHGAAREIRSSVHPEWFVSPWATHRSPTKPARERLGSDAKAWGEHALGGAITAVTEYYQTARSVMTQQSLYAGLGRVVC